MQSSFAERNADFMRNYIGATLKPRKDPGGLLLNSSVSWQVNQTAERLWIWMDMGLSLGFIGFRDLGFSSFMFVLAAGYLPRILRVVISN